MTPYYSEPGVTIYCGDARDLIGQLPAEAIITDPVWPNSVFSKVASPTLLLAETLEAAAPTVARVVIELGCTSDPRFLCAVPSRWPMFRVCWLEYARPSYIGRVLYTGDVAYAFGTPPPSEPGAHLVPGRVIASRSEGTRGTGATDKTYQREKYARLEHPAPRNLQHVRWLVKWFGGASVCDPFMGTGTAAVACKELGVPFVGVEIEERYCELAVERLRQGIIFPTADSDVSRRTWSIEGPTRPPTGV